MNDDGQNLPEAQNPEEDQNPLVDVNGVHVLRQDGTEALRHHGCPAEDNETVLGSRVEDPDFDENYADAVDQHFKCYVCREAVDALWTRPHPPLNERPAE